MNTPNHNELATLSRSLDGQMTAYDDLVKAEEANIKSLEKALAEANERLTAAQNNRREVAIQYRDVTALVHRAEDAAQYETRTAINDRIERFT